MNLGNTETRHSGGCASITAVFEAVPEQDLDGSTYASLLYARGYYLTAGDIPDLGRHWRTSKIGTLALGWDSRNPASITTGNGHQIAVVGLCYDLALSTGNPQIIGQHLLGALIEGPEAFDAAVYNLAGRFVVIGGSPDGIFLETDATGMKAAYYNAGGGTIASHSRLAALLSGNSSPSQFGKDDWFGGSSAFTYPGRYTEYEGIYLLTPNTRVFLREAKIQRVFPLGEPPQMAAADVAARVLPLMQEQFGWLTSVGEPQISLTAGLDSRVTLAASRPYRDECLYFSYATARGGNTQSTRQDLEFASQLATAEGLRHLRVEAPEGVPTELASVMAQNSKRVHARAVAYAYRNQLPPRGVHVRSNVYEVGRAYYQHGSRRQLPPLTMKRMAQLLIRKEREPTPGVIDAFHDWAETTSFGELPSGYDAHDFYYWEIRMGSWMQAVLLESDIAHDTYILVNSRRILNLFLSVEKQSRMTGSAMYHLIHQAWPKLLELPVNGVPMSSAVFK